MTSHRLAPYGIALLVLVIICPQETVRAQTSEKSLLEARRAFKTNLVAEEKADLLVAPPPRGMFNVVKYKSPAGELSAYLTPDPKDGKKHPAILWVFGGFDNSIGDTAWKRAEADNDQSARAFREAGIVMMYPSFRGGNKNPGFKETFLGEVDDLLAAADFLSRQPFVDPERIYLGGHSTGGTMALLAAESSDRFRAVFAFGPVEAVGTYGRDRLPFDLTNKQELLLRAPVAWLHCVKRPLFVFEGKSEPSNTESIATLIKYSKNPKIKFFQVEGATHFSILAPVTQLIAERILRDTEEDLNITFTEQELKALLHK